MWVLACFCELQFQWQFNFCSLFSFTLIFLVYQVLLGVPLVRGGAAKGSRRGLPRPGSQVYWWRRAVVRSSHRALFLLVSWVCRDEESPWTRLPVIAGSLPYPFQCLWLGENSLRLIGAKKLPGPNPSYNWDPLAGLAFPTHISISDIFSSYFFLVGLLKYPLCQWYWAHLILSEALLFSQKE